MNTRKRSELWKINKEELKILVEKSKTFTEILRQYGFNPHGGNMKTLKTRLDFDKIDYTHIINNGAKYNSPQKMVIALEKVLVENCDYSRAMLKKRLLKANLLKNVCAICGQPPTWNNKTLVLILDHINGINNDNRFENLRLLCPNCNSQTSTFAGKRRGQKLYNCKYKCGNQLSKNYRVCPTCKEKNRLNRRKTLRPNYDILNEQIKEFGYCGTAKIYGVSDNAIRKWLK